MFSSIFGNKVVKVQAQTGVVHGICEEITLVYSTKRLGSGRFGVVRKAKLEETGKQVAVKTSNITNTGSTREVEVLQELKHCNIINMIYHFHRHERSNIKEYIVMEYMPGTLWDLYNKRNKITEFETKLYMYQLLRALAYMHHKHVCHRDVKPENILIDPNTGILKLADLGLATKFDYDHTNIVGTLFYLAPELLFGFTNYRKAVDIWSAGLILIELLKGGAEFHNTTFIFVVNQQRKILMKYFGTPTQDQFEGMRPKFPFDDLPKKRAKSWSQIVKPGTIYEDAISLCSQLLCYSPNSRLLPHNAVAHKFFDDLRSPESKFLANGNRLPPLFNFEPGEFPGVFDHLIPAHTCIKDIGETRPVQSANIEAKPVKCVFKLLNSRDDIIVTINPS